MTQLREQMIQDMVLRGMAPSTQRAYLQAVAKFARHYNRSPDRISNQELKPTSSISMSRRSAQQAPATSPP